MRQSSLTSIIDAVSKSERPRKSKRKMTAEEIDAEMPLRRFQELLDPWMKVGMATEYVFGYEELGHKWRSDFAWPDLKPPLLVEIEGGIHYGKKAGRHIRPIGYEEDCEKYSWASLLGFRLIRLTSGMIRKGAAYRLMREALKDLYPKKE
jgi:hypothetical protein